MMPNKRGSGKVSVPKLKQYIEDGLSLISIGDCFGVSKQRIHQIIVSEGLIQRWKELKPLRADMRDFITRSAHVRVCPICKEEFYHQSLWTKTCGKETCRKTHYQSRPGLLKADAKYGALHKWVRRHFGAPDHCDICGVAGKRHYVWSHKTHEYPRSAEGWWQLCRGCLFRYDRQILGIMGGRKKKTSA
jgi:hypothetical protein